MTPSGGRGKRGCPCRNRVGVIKSESMDCGPKAQPQASPGQATQERRPGSRKKRDRAPTGRNTVRHFARCLRASGAAAGRRLEARRSFGQPPGRGTFLAECFCLPPAGRMAKVLSGKHLACAGSLAAERRQAGGTRSGGFACRLGCGKPERKSLLAISIAPPPNCRRQKSTFPPPA